MDRIKIYLDTSAFGFLQQPLMLDKQAITRQFYDWIIDNDRYVIHVSPVAIRELTKCPEDLRIMFLSKLRLLRPVYLRDDRDVVKLQQKYIEHGFLTRKSDDDLLHIAFAVHNDCDMIISWNFKHFVNENTIYHLQRINRNLGLRTIEIISPATFMERVNYGNGLDDHSSRN